jgi:hypothetical protein
MALTTKRISVLLLAGALVALILLAAGLSNLRLQSGTPFPGGGNPETGAPSVGDLPALQTYSLPLVRGIFAVIFLVLMLYVPARLVAFVRIRNVLLLLVIALGLFVLGYLLPDAAPGQPVVFPNEPADQSAPATTVTVTPLGQPPQWLIWLVLSIFVVGIALLTFRLLKAWSDSARLKREILKEAEGAVTDIKAGKDFSNVVIRCYLQMTRVIEDQQGLERNVAMTVQEFEEILSSKGFPAAPIHQLTCLFEKVRYGRYQIRFQDEERAVESLDEIIRFCRRQKE